MSFRLSLREVLTGILLLLVGGLVGWRLFRLYSTGRPYDPYLHPAREFLGAGLAPDSAKLARLAPSASAVEWALELGRRDPALLRGLVRDLRIVAGRHLGEATAVVFEGSSHETCRDRPIVITFVGRPGAARIQDVSTDCGNSR